MGLPGTFGPIDDALTGVSTPIKAAVTALALAACAGAALPNVPRAYADYSRYPVLRHIPQPEGFGTDTISDMYGARVVRNDPLDMYTKASTEQTALERATWSKLASSPYPPLALLVLAACSAIGDATGVGLYGMVLGLAVLFLALTAVYSLKTRWYLFPLLCVNAPYIATRFVHVQDGSYLVMLVVVMGALFLARRRSNWAHALMALAACVKLSPLYYLRHVFSMERRWALLVVGIVFAGLVLPVFVLDGYLSIYTYQAERKGLTWLNTAGALALVVPFALTLWFVEARLDFDMEDRVGWGVVPFAAFMAISMNSARHLFLVLLVPDKRVARTVAGVAGMAVHVAFPWVVRSGTAVYIILGLLWIVLARYAWRARAGGARLSGEAGRA